MGNARIIQLIAAAVCMCSGLSRAVCLSPELDFYTAMSQMVMQDRNYLLTSNAYGFLDMGSGPESYETLLFMKFANLPDAEVESAWLRMASGATASMGSMTRPVVVSVHPVDMDAALMANYAVTPKDFYVNSSHILAAVDSIPIYQDGICYWDITETVNNWVRFQHSNGLEGYENLGLSLTGRNDEGALNPDDTQHVGFWSSRAVDLPHAAQPMLYVKTSLQDNFDMPWVPDWSANPAFTCQFWNLSSKGGRLQPPLVPDAYQDNMFGDPNLVWEKETVFNGTTVINPFLTWHPFADTEDPNGHPVWVDGVYGGVYRAGPYSPHTLTATVPTGTSEGVLTVLVQYDWYSRGVVDVSVPSACEATPSGFHSDVIGKSASHRWYRTTRVFEIEHNPGQIKVDFVVSGEEPYIDSLSITTAVNVLVVKEPLRHEMDINLDGIINLTEYAVLASHWEQTGTDLDADFNDDGYVDLTDVARLAEVWMLTSPYRLLQMHP